MNYTIIDLETTGFGKYDRIVEVGMVKVNSFGEIIESFSTLVNPNRDISASHIHGITATMVKGAPSFEEIHYHVNEFMKNSVPVSHNKTFDFKFLSREMKLSGVSNFEMDGLCTLQLSKIAFPELPCRKLSSLCEYFDIDLENYHTALDDSIATANALQILLSEIKGHEKFKYHIYDIPNNGLRRIEFTRDKSSIEQKAELNKLSRVIRNQPDFDTQSDYNVSEYLNLLDRILEDRIVTDDEAELVKEYATDFKISSSTLSKIHEEYFRRLCSYYLEDEVISETESIDLNLISSLLGIDKTTCNLILQLEKGQERDIKKKSKKVNPYEGKSVCFTGALICELDGCKIDREKAHELAIGKGLIIKSGVSSKLDILVVADPNTNSGKAKKARGLSIPIIAEMVFWNSIGINTN
jgi:DNA polymerase-3 subunit epsilon